MMIIKKKLVAVAAGLIGLALVAGGAGTAYAAPGEPLNPQSNGSKGSFFLLDEEAQSAESSTRVRGLHEYFFASGDPTDYNKEINPAATRPVTGATPFTQVWRFISEPNATAVAGGQNTWKAWATDSAAGPDGGTLQPDFTLDAFGPKVPDVVAAGGHYWYGIAYTINGGVTTIGAVYRDIYITAGSGDYTVGDVEIEQAGSWSPNFADYTATAGASAVIRNGNLEIDATAANANKTVDVWAEGQAAKAATVTLGADGKAINTLPAGIADGTRLALAENETVLAWIATSTFGGVQEPNDADNAATKVTAEDVVQNEGSASVVLHAGAANASSTFTAYGWSTPSNLGQVTTDASGDVTVDVSSLQDGNQHTIALVDGNDEVVAWVQVVVPATVYPLTSNTNLTATVQNSGKFALEGVAAAVDLGSIKRGSTTVAKSLGGFTVTDDRDDLKGWTLKADALDFTNGANTIAKSALGIAPKIVGGETDGIVAGSDLVAGSATYSATIFDAAAGSTTLDTGAQLDTDLTFKAPKTAKKGTYTSTLTLTLASK